MDGTGPRMLELTTAGADNESARRGSRGGRLVRGLVEGGRRGSTSTAPTRPVGWNDVLVVAPYNAQVAGSQRLLPPTARVGTVDKFQGQEAPSASSR